MMTSAAIPARELSSPLQRVRLHMRHGIFVPVVTLTALILVVWYLSCLPMNRDLPQLANVQGLTNRYQAAWNLERPVLPAPHQIIADLYESTVGTRLFRETADGWALNPRTPGVRSTTSNSQSPSALHQSNNACPR